MSSLLHDLVSLLELQLQLLTADVREARGRATGAAIGLGVGAVLAISALPLLLAALGFVLVEFAEWPVSGALALVGGTALAVAGALGWMGWNKLLAAVGTFQRSRTELKETLIWVKGALRPSSRNFDDSDAREYDRSRPL